MDEDIVHVKLEIKIPNSKWLAKTIRRFPDLEISIISKFLINKDQGSTLFEIKGHDLTEFLKFFKKCIKTINFQILHDSNDILIINVRTRDPWILNALLKSELLLLRYPLYVKEDRIQIEVLNKRKNIEFFLKHLETYQIQYKLITIGKYHESPILTKKQREVLKIAYKMGFYSIPRRVTLTRLAMKLKISPSALSELLRRSHARLVKDYFK
ncbi:MAG: helix-turn-helix domain-containing protein [Promethearchaeota archaeon]